MDLSIIKPNIGAATTTAAPSNEYGYYLSLADVVGPDGARYVVSTSNRPVSAVIVADGDNGPLTYDVGALSRNGRIARPRTAELVAVAKVLSAIAKLAADESGLAAFVRSNGTRRQYRKRS